MRDRQVLRLRYFICSVTVQPSGVVLGWRFTMIHLLATESSLMQPDFASYSHLMQI